MKKIFFIFTFLLCGCQNPTARNKENDETVCSFDISEINKGRIQLHLAYRR